MIVNQTFTLKCEAHGDPVPSYTWQHNGENISFSPVYMIPDVTTQDSGSYVCIVTYMVEGIFLSDNETVEVMVLSS